MGGGRIRVGKPLPGKTSKPGASNHDGNVMQAKMWVTAGLLGSVAGLAGTAMPAEAGTYPMRSCNVPGQAPAGTGPWVWENAAYTISYNACGAGDGFGITFPNAHQMNADTLASLALGRPNSGPRKAIGIRQVRLWTNTRLEGTGSSLFALSYAYAGPAAQQAVVYRPPGTSSESDVWTSPVYPVDTDTFRFSLQCSSNASQGCAPQASTPLLVRGAEVTLQEDVSPRVDAVGGSLLTDQRQTATQSVSYEGADDESGVASIEVLLDTQAVGRTDYRGGVSCPFDNWNACSTTAAGSINVDTRAVNDGTYTLQLRATDAAGNVKTTQAPQPVIVANGAVAASGPPNGDGASSAARLKVYFAKGHKAHLTKSWSGRARVTGRLTDQAGHGIGKASIDVSEVSSVPGSKRLKRKPIKTDAKGQFSYMVPAKRSSRRVRFEYRARLGAAVPDAAREATTQVRAAAKFAVHLRGITVRYTGRLMSGPIPRAGKQVTIQGRATGGRWTTFAARRTSRKGRFSGRYRLRAHRPGVRLQFRVRVPPAHGYPYTTGFSKVAARTVH